MRGYARILTSVRRASNSLRRDVTREEAVKLAKTMANKFVEKNAKFFKKRSDSHLHPSMTKVLGPIWHFMEEHNYKEVMFHLSKNKDARAHDWKAVIDHIWETAEYAQVDIRFSAHAIKSRAQVLTSALKKPKRIPGEAAIYALQKLGAEDGVHASVLLRHFLANPTITSDQGALSLTERQLLVEGALQGLKASARAVVDLWETPLLHDHLQGMGRGRMHPSVYSHLEAKTGARMDTANDNVLYDAGYTLLDFVRPSQVVGAPPPVPGKEFDTSFEALTGMRFNVDAFVNGDRATALAAIVDGVTTRADGDGDGDGDDSTDDGNGAGAGAGAGDMSAEFELFSESRALHQLFLRKLHALAPRWRGTLDPFASTPLHEQRQAFVNHVYRLSVVEVALQRMRARGDLTPDATKAKQLADRLYTALRNVDPFTPMRVVWKLAGMDATGGDDTTGAAPAGDDVSGDGVDTVDQLAREEAMASFLMQQGHTSDAARRDADHKYMMATRGLRFTTAVPASTGSGTVGAASVAGAVATEHYADGDVDVDALLLRNALLYAKGKDDPEETLMQVEIDHMTATLKRTSEAVRFLTAATALNPSLAMRDATAAVRRLTVLHALYGARAAGGAATALPDRRHRLAQHFGMDIANLVDAVALYVDQNHKAKDLINKLAQVRLRNTSATAAIASSPASRLQQTAAVQIKGGRNVNDTTKGSVKGASNLADGLLLAEETLGGAVNSVASGKGRDASVVSLMTAVAMQPAFNAMNAMSAASAVSGAWSQSSGLSTLLAEFDTALTASVHVDVKKAVADINAARVHADRQSAATFAAALVAAADGDTSFLPITSVSQALSSSRSALSSAVAAHPSIARIPALCAALNAPAHASPREFGLPPSALVAQTTADTDWTRFAREHPAQAAQVLLTLRHIATCFTAMEDSTNTAAATAAVVGAPENTDAATRMRAAALAGDAQADAELSALVAAHPAIASQLLAKMDNRLSDPFAAAFAAIAADNSAFDAFLGQAATSAPVQRRLLELIASIPSIESAAKRDLDAAALTSAIEAALQSPNENEKTSQLLALLASDDIMAATDAATLEDAIVTGVANMLGDASCVPPFVRSDSPAVMGTPQHPRAHFSSTGEYVGKHDMSKGHTFHTLDDVDASVDELADGFAASPDANLTHVPAMSYSPPTAVPTADQYAFLLASLKGRFAQPTAGPLSRLDFVGDVVQSAVDAFAAFCEAEGIVTADDAAALKKRGVMGALTGENVPQLTSEQRAAYAKTIGLEGLTADDAVGIAAALRGETSLSTKAYDEQAAAWYHAANSEALLAMIRGWLFAARFDVPFRLSEDMHNYGVYNETSAVDEKAEAEERFWMALMDVLASMRVHDIPANANHMHELISAFSARRDLTKALELLSEARANDVPLRTATVLEAASILQAVEDRLSVEEHTAIVSTLFKTWIAGDGMTHDLPSNMIDLHLALTSDRLPEEWTEFVLASCFDKCGNDDWVVTQVVQRLKYDSRLFSATAAMTCEQLAGLCEDDDHPGPVLIHAYVAKCIAENNQDKLQSALSCAMKHSVVIDPNMRAACLQLLSTHNRRVAMQLFEVMDREFAESPAHALVA
ncbi:hypothetical protein PTSG_09215 [Salpingoeca rosetta]|uniref:Uncharacterized protein n=1 Tax=Salpingoeca rosetta (strain ATCC 50818 / BSB-021) TaxID=946362 RepID=F2UN18_SALR5|nr:uncharacterized protein PTSG_09215 [Salpingoeca rosetta]EGD78517.1 hypothetical protein PTSG_09215 [Salpingoeca rosetta]|eukprot:XP_004989466.1 hypothetical protein PTSG_09215 [Salpingoeca rosetta]